MAPRDDRPHPADRPAPGLRVLACLGSIADEEQTIEAAFALAGALQAQVAGCFVEESNLLDLAALPFARAVRPTGEASAPLDLLQMQQHIAGAAALWKRTLNARAERSRITVTFDTLRGEYCAEIARVAAATDIVVVNPQNVAGRAHNAVAAILGAVRDPAVTVLLPGGRQRMQAGPVVLLAPDGVPDAGAFHLADRVASTTGSGILVAMMPGGEGQSEAIRAAARETVHGELQVRRLPAGEIGAAAASIGELQPSFVIWPPRPDLAGQDAETLLRATHAPLLLMRPERAPG
jgi:hypothetical protein